MTLYIAVTPDHLELPMYVADTAEEMAEWAGVKVQSVKSSCSRNKRRGILPPGFGISAPYRLRRLDFEEDET
jgi:hypothetical protein